MPAAPTPVGRKKGVTSFDRTTIGGITVSTFAGAPTSGASGTYFGQMPKGSLLVDTTNAKLYINTGTLASPTWTVVGTQS